MLHAEAPPRDNFEPSPLWKAGRGLRVSIPPLFCLGLRACLSETFHFPGKDWANREHLSSGHPTMSKSTGSDQNCTHLWLKAGESPAISSVMFSAGVLGNLIALALLARRWRGDSRNSSRRGSSISLFHVLVTELVFTDLLGTCLISPVVLVSYARNKTLLALEPVHHGVCTYFAFAMTFFSLATMLMLFAMAVERYLSIGHPYFYQSRVTCRAGLAVLPSIYTVSLVFCSLPLLGYGEYDQYCPGTWCFIRPSPTGYLKLYASLLLILITAVLLCNFSVIFNLIRMHHRSRRTRSGPSLGSSRCGPGTRRKGGRLSMAEETDHLILLAVMTITFAICSLPFTVSQSSFPQLSSVQPAHTLPALSTTT